VRRLGGIANVMDNSSWLLSLQLGPPPATWRLAIDLLSVRWVIPLWRQAGVPMSMRNHPLVLLRASRQTSAALALLSAEAGAREIGGEPGVLRWYQGSSAKLVADWFDRLQGAYGLPPCLELAFWVAATEPGDEPYESERIWDVAFGLIAQDRPSRSYVEQHVPPLAREIIRLSCGPSAQSALEEEAARVGARKSTGFERPGQSS
jgi:hypothetical protein